MFNFTKKNIHLSCVVVILCCSSAVCAEPFGLNNAKNLIEYNDDMIEFFAHPSVNHIGCEFDGSKETSSGFKVRYTFRWKNDDGERHYNSFDFYFDDDAKITSIDPVDQSNIIPPFFASDLLSIAAGGAFDEILKDTNYTRSQIQELLKNGESKEILTLILRAKQR